MLLLTSSNDPDAAATMGLPHSIVRQPQHLPLKEGGFDLKSAGGYSQHAPEPNNIDFSLPMNTLTS